MTAKNKQNAENNQAPAENWRKPLQVPPRTNSMRAFYQGNEEESNQTVKSENSTAPSGENEVRPITLEQNARLSTASAKKQRKETVKVKSAEEPGALENNEIIKSNNIQTNSLHEEELTRHLGFEIDELFDVHELLRGKSFDIYQILLQSRDEKGRCKITQPELMKRADIKNRRTFYKHEQWLINLKLLEKRHLPGDHKGVVYRIFEMADVLPIPNATLEQFTALLKGSE